MSSRILLRSLATRALAVSALVHSLLSLAACTPDFESSTIVRDLRILAVRAEPPEALVDLQANTVEDVQVTVLFADPGAVSGQKARLEADACFPSDSGR